MKKLHELTLGAAFALLALSACTNEAELLPDAPQTNEPDNPDACVLAAKDFRWEGNESRTALTIEENVAKFSWTPGDQVGILPDAGAQVYFTIPEPEEGEEMTNTATFDGGAWALKATSNYAAYYPFIKDFDLQRTAVPVGYTGQKQTGNNNAAHLGAYDYMGARPVQTNENGGGVTFDFDHVGALVILKFTVPESGTQLKSVTLSADGASFTTQGTYDLTSAEGFPITPTETAESMTIGLDYTTTADDETVTLYFMCAPIDLSGKKVSVSVACGGTEGETIEFEADGKNLVAAGGYLMEAKKKIPYLTFAASDEQTFTITAKSTYAFLPFTLPESLEYSVGDGDWTQLTSGTGISFGGDKGTLRLRGKSSIGTAESVMAYSQIAFGDGAVKVACTGDIRTLVDWENYATASTAEARFCQLFSSCTALTTAPELPAETLADNCYYYMFYDCTSLTTAPELPSTKLANSCYSNMFYKCTSLTTAPELPAETLANFCYTYMFNRCTALTTAPELPATTLAEYCYNCMFQSCTSLTTSPVLPATTLAEACYYSMFNNCTNLSSITMLATDISAEKCLDSWVEGVASSGTFYKNSEATWTTTGTNGIPEGWTVQTYEAPED